MKSRAAWSFVIVSPAIILTSARASFAQTSTPLDRLDPAPAGDPFFTVASSNASEGFKPAFGALVSDAGDPLVFRSTTSGDLYDRVGHQLFFHVLASLQALGRIELDVDAPFLLDQGGTGARVQASSAALGDLRLGGRVSVLAQRGFVPAASIGFHGWLPSGASSAFVSSNTARYAPSIGVSADYGRVLWALASDGRFQASSSSWIGSEVAVRAAINARVGPIRFGPEGYVAGNVDAPVMSARAGTHGEALLGARGSFAHFEAGFAAGFGLGNAVGAPSYRLIGTLVWSPDAIRDAKDGEGGDRDRMRADEASAAEAQRRAYAEAARVESAEPPVHDDVKPPEPPPPPVDTSPSVHIEGTQIVILDQVNFETGNDTISQSSFGLLGQVATVISAHPEIARVGVDGHTDNVGAEKANLALSRRRAVAVVRWLVEHGIDARRLESRGFGPRRPIADNKTEQGRAKNRRVEFQILARGEGEQSWRDGPLQ